MRGEDEQAFTQFVADRGPHLVRLARGLLRDPHQAEDVVQDVLSRAFLRWGRIQAVDDPDAYVRKMVVNACTSWFRRAARREFAHDNATLPEGRLPDPSSAIDDRDQVLALLRQFLAAFRRAAVGPTAPSPTTTSLRTVRFTAKGVQSVVASFTPRTRTFDATTATTTYPAVTVTGGPPAVRRAVQTALEHRIASLVQAWGQRVDSLRAADSSPVQSIEVRATTTWWHTVTITLEGHEEIPGALARRAVTAAMPPGAVQPARLAKLTMRRDPGRTAEAVAWYPTSEGITWVVDNDGSTVDVPDPVTATIPWTSLAGLLAALLAAGVLAACGSGPVPGPGRAQSATASAEPEVTISPDGFVPTWIKDLTIVHDSSEDARCPWSTRYPDVPGAARLTKALREEVASWQAVARSGPAAGRSDDCFEPAGTSGLQIGFDFLIASGDVVGVRLRVDDSGGGSQFRTTRTYWYDGESGTLGVPLSLFADSSLPAVTERIVKELSAFPGADPSMARASLSPQYRADLVTDLSFDAAGAVHLRLPAGEFAPVELARPEPRYRPHADAGHQS